MDTEHQLLKKTAALAPKREQQQEEVEEPQSSVSVVMAKASQVDIIENEGDQNTGSDP